jgi:Domain of unknown function (DUF1854)
VTDVAASAIATNAKGIRLSRDSAGGLLLTFPDGRSFAGVQVVRAAPLSQPSRYICFLDSNDQEIFTLQDLCDLDLEDRLLVEEELRVRYISSVIHRVIALRREGGTLYWETETDRGLREFVVQSSDESVRWLGERRLLLIDVDGNRLTVPDISALDRTSARILTDNLI